MKLINLNLKDIQVKENIREVNPKDKDLITLKNSISVFGVRQPIIVTKSENGKYNLIAGRRRYTACKELKLTEIPALIQEIGDEQTTIAQIIENVERKNLSPSEEGKAFAKAFAENKNVKDIAAMTGRSEKFIRDRMSFNNLIPELIKKVDNNEVSIESASYLSKLNKDLQKEIDKNYPGWILKDITRLKKAVENNYLMSIKNAGFDPKDPKLSKLGACIDCKFLTSNSPEIFTEFVKDPKCTNRECYVTKLFNTISVKLEALKNQGEKIAVMVNEAVLSELAENLEKHSKTLGYPILEASDIRLKDKVKKTNAKLYKLVIAEGKNFGKVFEGYLIKDLVKESKTEYKSKTDEKSVTQVQAKNDDDADTRFYRKLDLINFPRYQEVFERVLPMILETKTLKTDNNLFWIMVYVIFRKASFGIEPNETTVLEDQINKCSHIALPEKTQVTLIKALYEQILELDSDSHDKERFANEYDMPLMRFIANNHDIKFDEILAEIDKTYEILRNDAKERFIKRNNREPKLRKE